MMKQYSLKISSKNEKSLNHFLSFFLNCLNTKFNIIQKLVRTHNTKKVITLLKSPHVNKTAQEQFEMRIFCKQILAKSFYLEKNLIFIKKMLNKLFKDISVTLEFTTNKNRNFMDSLFIFYPDSFKLSKTKVRKTNLERNKQKSKLKTSNSKKNSLFNLTKFLSTISICGEMLAINQFNSSFIKQKNYIV